MIETLNMMELSMHKKDHNQELILDRKWMRQTLLEEFNIDGACMKDKSKRALLQDLEEQCIRMEKSIKASIKMVYQIQL